MACLKATGNFDIEELLRKRNVDFYKVAENYPAYKAFLQTLYNFYEQEHNNPKFKQKFMKLFNTLTRNKQRLTMKKTYMVYVYQKMVRAGEIKETPEFLHYIQKRPARNLSGVNSFAILLPPFPVTDDFNGCTHNCYYCPNQTKANGADVDIARSYLLKEPAVQRGFRNGWDAIKQMNDRLQSLTVQGHEADKLELIIEGGTYTEYPMEFLETFHRDLFYTANVFFDSDKRKPKTLQEEIKINSTTQVRIIGICIETRPDAIDDEWIRFFRHSGTTRIQLGVQHTDSRILKKINRGHTFQESIDAVRRLKDNCFKIDIHLMPDLPLATPELDKEMFEIIFHTDVLAPDQVKIYPCEVVPFTVLKKWHDEGKFTPYSDKDPQLLMDVVKYAMRICPPWVRMPRIIRDIPLEYIQGGNRYGNLRQMITDQLKKEGTVINEIRSREIGRHLEYKFKDSKYMICKYMGSEAREYFLSVESRDKRAIFGFLRLRIPPKNHNPIFPILKNKGLIRELHVYNHLVCVGTGGNKNTTQHRGIGKGLLKLAEWISWSHGLRGTAVITGEGVRTYYHKRGYHDDDTFVVKNFICTIYECGWWFLALVIFHITVYLSYIYTDSV
jgi:ELP3 family radical SAM enzyme/protein acetyltransferase